MRGEGNRCVSVQYAHTFIWTSSDKFLTIQLHDRIAKAPCKQHVRIKLRVQAYKSIMVTGNKMEYDRLTQRAKDRTVEEKQREQVICMKPTRRNWVNSP